MFEIGGTELLLIAVVALIVIGPKELPNALRTVGRYTGKARAMTRHLRSGFDEMMRQAELEEMEKQWAEHNRKIMTEMPVVPDYTAPPTTSDEEQPAAPEDSLPPHGGSAGEGGGAASADLTETPPAEATAPPETIPPAERPLP